MELPVISFNADRTLITEGGEAQLLTFHLSKPAPAGGLTVKLNIDDPDGEGADTEFPPELISNIIDFGQVEEDGTITASLTIAEDATSATFGISAIEDDEAEGEETYSLTLLADETYIADPTSTTITTTIEDNMTLPIVSLSTDKTIVSEGGEPQLITFNFSELTPADGLIINLRTSSSDGSQGDVGIASELFSNIVDFDVTVENGVSVANIRIAGGVTSATVGTKALADNEVEGSETYSLTLLESENYSINPAFSTIITTIEDTSTDLPTVSITPESVSVTEGETFAWNISLDTPAPEGGLSLFLSITDNNDPAPGDVNYFVEGSSNITAFEFVLKDTASHITSNESISQVYAFGDSYSEDGLSLEISTDAVEAGVPDSFILPADPELGLYDPEGRWTNGETAVEVLADNLGVDLTNYAVGGAKSGDGNYYGWLDSLQNTGVFGQIDQFNAELAGQPADPDALYFIFASANDFFEYADFGLPGTIEELAVQTVENLKDGITDLAESGAEKFLVVNSSDLGILPGTIEFGQAEDAALFTEEINNLLPQELSTLESELGIDLVLYDHEAISDEIRANPEEYGLTNINHPYQPVFPVETPSGNSDEYYFWDEYHPTSRTHEIIGEDMLDFLDFTDEGEVSEGFNITIAEGETEAVLVSQAISDDLAEEDEIFTTAIAESEDYLIDSNQSEVTTTISDASTDATNLIDLTSFTVEVSATTNAGFVNIGGFYQAIDTEGTVIDPVTGHEISPTDAGYEDAALANSVVEIGDGEEATLELDGGFVYVPYLLANSMQFFTAFEAANADGLNHVQSAGENTFGFEDLLGGGDNDFDDYVISFDIV